MAKTKLGSASRYGARYSTPLKQIVRDIEEIQKKKQVCPVCGRKSLKRKGNSIWECSKCGAVIAGGAYEPTTKVGEAVRKIVSRQKPVTLEEVEKVEELEEEAV